MGRALSQREHRALLGITCEVSERSSDPGEVNELRCAFTDARAECLGRQGGLRV